ncbi:hypothetical protein V1VFAS_127 [Rhizobium phage V1VFA-S]|nr:hypothetical protein V1VFAS_127 [Rhizobium phage V1VFA-S]
MSETTKEFCEKLIAFAETEHRDERARTMREAAELIGRTLITDDMVERAAKALEKKIKQDTYGWSEEDFETWWNRDSRFFKQIHVWGWFKGTEKEKCLHEARIMLEAALS